MANGSAKDILIVGAGPTGLTAALAAHARGLRPRVIERKESPSTLSRAVGLLPSSIKTFDALGIGEVVRAEAIEIEQADYHRNGEYKFSLTLNADPDPMVRIWSLPQDRTEAILGEALIERGIAVEYGKPFETLEEEDGAYRVTAGGDIIACEEILGADGAKSDVRQAIGVEAAGFELPEDWSIADIDVAHPVPRHVTLFFNGDHDAVFMIPMEQKRVRLVSNTPDTLAVVGDEVEVANVRREARFRIGIRQVDRYRVGGVSLAGDAAHTHSPVGGRGMNLGIADAAEWAERLANGTLDGYSASRHEKGAHVIALSERARKTLLGGSKTKRALALGVLSVASRVPPLAKRFTRLMILG